MFTLNLFPLALPVNRTHKARCSEMRPTTLTKTTHHMTCHIKKSMSGIFCFVVSLFQDSKRNLPKNTGRLINEAGREFWRAVKYWIYDGEWSKSRVVKRTARDPQGSCKAEIKNVKTDSLQADTEAKCIFKKIAFPLSVPAFFFFFCLRANKSAHVV